MRFADYYRGQFRTDLAEILACTAPSRHTSAAMTFIQPSMLSSRNRWVRGMQPDQRLLLEQALFLTFLTDQVAYTYRKPCYARFRSLTMYPKFTGDCPGGCHSHWHPRMIFGLVGAAPGRYCGPAPTIAQCVADVLEVYQTEVEHFTSTLMPELDGPDFWSLCRAEMP